MSGRTSFTRTSLQGVLLSLQWQGFWLIQTTSKTDSMSWLSALDAWWQKTEHRGFTNRPRAEGETLRDKQIHVMKGFEIGHKTAAAIVDHYSGLPFELKEDVTLTDVPGVGKVIEERIWRIFWDESST